MDIVTYILKELSKDEDISEIRNTLINKGWKKEDVDDAIEVALGEKHERLSFGSLKKFLLIFTNPADFFLSIRFEKTLKQPAIYLTLNFLMVITVLWLRWDIKNFSIRSSFGMAVLFLFPIILILGEVFLFIIALVFSFTVHLFSKLFGNTLPFPYTWKVVAYSLTPLLLTIIFMGTRISTFLSFPLLLWSAMLIMYGMYEVLELSPFGCIVSTFSSYLVTYLFLILISQPIFKNPFYLASKIFGV